MPLYDLKCPNCDTVTECHCEMMKRHCQRCHKCGELMNVLISQPSAAHVFQPDWYYLGSKDKVFVRSKAQLFEECRKRDKIAVGHDQEWKPPQHEPKGGLKRAREVATESYFGPGRIPE